MNAIRFILSNTITCFFVVALYLLAQLIHVHVRLLHSSLWQLSPFAVFALYGWVNRSLLSRLSRWVRVPLVLLVAVALSFCTLVVSRVSVRSLQGRYEAAPVLLSGRITDAAGSPIAGATVSLFHQDPSEAARHTEFEVQTDRDGRFEATSRRGHHSITVTANGYAGLQLARDAKNKLNPDWNLALPYSVVVVGRLLDPHGNPLADRVVHLAPLSAKRRPSTEPFFVGGRSPEPSGPDGRFTIATAAPCVNRISVQSNGGGAWQSPLNGHHLDLTSGQAVSSVDIVLRPVEAYAISGHVLDAAGRPLSNWYCGVHIPHGSAWWDQTDENGAFSIQGLDGIGASRHTLHFGPREGGGTSFDLYLDHVPVHTTNLVLTIPDRASFCGSLRDGRTGAPLTSYDIRCESIRFPESGALLEKPRMEVDRTRNGSFCISNLWAGEASLVVRAPGYGAQRFSVTLAAGANGPLTLDMKGPAVLEITTTLNGTPHSFTVVADKHTLPLEKNGMRRIDDLPNGRNSLWISGAEDGQHRRRVDTELKSGETTRINVEMGGSCEISGTVTYPDVFDYCMVRLSADPVFDVWPSGSLSCPEEGLFVDTLVWKSGSAFLLRDIPPGRWHLTVGMDHLHSLLYTPVWTRVLDLSDGERQALAIDLSELEIDKVQATTVSSSPPR
jgi:protocatechuate 3,4-dioxygenase beta subunit